MIAKPPHKAYDLFPGGSCLGCPLEHKGIGFSLPDGEGPVLLIGEALGRDESRSGKPFVGAAGYCLNKTLARSRLDREKDFTIWNIVACRPPNNWLDRAPWERGAANHCRQYLSHVVDKVRPRVIVPMGGVAMRHLLGREGIMDSHAPQRGYVYDCEVELPNQEIYKCVALPTIHPSFILQGNTALSGVQIHDLQKAVRVSKQGEPVDNPHYILSPSRADLDFFVREAREKVGGDTWLTCDIETGRSAQKSEDEVHELERSEIRCISFAHTPGHAITIPWTNRNLTYIQELLNLPAPYLVVWNEKFDIPHLKDAGMTIRAPVYDTMMSWHMLQSALPKGLGFVSSFYTNFREWKSLSDVMPAFYSCRDSDAAITCTYKIRECLREEGRHDIFLRHYVKLQPLLDEVAESGVLVDPVAREEFRGKLQEAADGWDQEMQELVPKEIMPIEEKIVLHQEAECWRCRGQGKDPDKKKLKEAGLTIKKLKVERNEPITGIFGYEPCKECGGEGHIRQQLRADDDAPAECQGYTRVGERWQKKLPFLVSSPEQIKKYIRLAGHKIPTIKGKETTGAKEIESLAKRYKSNKFYPLVLKIRKNAKLLNTYYGPGYEPDADGRIRTHYTQNASTHRLTSYQPNMQNVPSRGELAKSYRRMFIAGRGNYLCEIDYGSIEALICGWFASDSFYISAAKISIHAVLASHLLVDKGIWSSPIGLDGDAKASEKVAEIKKHFAKEYDDCKHVAHGSNYGATAFRIKQEYPDSFPTIKYAEYIQQLYFGTIAKGIRKWQHQTLLEADRKLYLENPFGYRHYFWNVLDGERLGQDSKAALAMLPQSTAGAVIKEAMLRIGQKQFYRKAMRLQVHDSLVFELPGGRLLDSRIEWLQREMSRPVPELDGLVIETEAKIGKHW